MYLPAPVYTLLLYTIDINSFIDIHSELFGVKDNLEQIIPGAQPYQYGSIGLEINQPPTQTQIIKYLELRDRALQIGSRIAKKKGDTEEYKRLKSLRKENKLALNASRRPNEPEISQTKKDCLTEIFEGIYMQTFTEEKKHRSIARYPLTLITSLIALEHPAFSKIARNYDMKIISTARAAQVLSYVYNNYDPDNPKNIQGLANYKKVLNAFKVKDTDKRGNTRYIRIGDE